MGTRWVTFDCFGTLVDLHTGFERILSPLASGRSSELLHAYHKFESLVEEERPLRPYRDVLITALARASREIGLRLSEAQACALPDSWVKMPLFPDVEPMFSQLRALGCHLAVLTNCDEDLFEQTHRTFRQRFDLVVTAERVRNYKPSPTQFRSFSCLSGVAHGDWIHVACSWHHDIMPASEIGIQSAWLDRDSMGEDASIASAHVRSAEEIWDAVVRLFGEGASGG
jgi:2-haloacid dehalogenase